MLDIEAINKHKNIVKEKELDKHRYTICPEIVNPLGLKAKTLKREIFTIIYNFNVNQQTYTGSIKYLMKMLDADKKTISHNLDDLVAMNFIIKEKGNCTTPSIYSINFPYINAFLDKKKSTQKGRGENPLGGKITSGKVPSRVGESFPKGRGENPPYNTIYITNNKTSSSSKEEKNNNATTATNFEDDKEKEIQSVLDCYMNNINPSISPIEVERLQEDIKDYSSKWVLEAIKRAVLQGKRKLGYVEAILNRWRVDGYDEIGDKHKADQREPPQDKQDTGEKIHVLNSNESLIQEYYKNKGANKNEHSS